MMTIKKYLISLVYIFMFGALACSQSVTPILPSPIFTLAETVTMESVPSTQTPIMPTYTPLASCVTTIEQPFQNLPDQGKIILYGILHISGASLSAPSYALDLQSGEKIILPQQKNKLIVDGSFSISPDRKWLAYSQVNSNSEQLLSETLHLVAADGTERKIIPINLYQRASLWLDNNQLLIESLKENWKANPDKAPSALLLLNPFTGESRELFNDYPDQWNGDTLFWRFNLSRVIYSPTLTRVIYPTFVEPNRVMRLVNVQTNQILADIPTSDYGKYPAWSPDGKLMAFATQTKKQANWDSYQDEIFTLAENGELLQLTHLSKVNSYSYITGLSWSADGHTIAFWVNNADWKKGYKGVHLATVDVFTGKMHEYCDMGTSNGSVYIPEWEDPMWSPDGKHLLVNVVDPNDDRHILIIIIDVTTGRAFQIADSYQAVGWLK